LQKVGDNTQGDTRHDAWQQGKDAGNKVGDNSKDESWVFDRGGKPRLAEFASMADAGKVALCLRSLPFDKGLVQAEFLTETNASNGTHQHEKQFVSMVRQGPNFFCRLPVCSLSGRFHDKAGRTQHQILGRRPPPKHLPANPTECAINVVSASPIFVSFVDKIVSSMEG
jgi:hypothetical protein